MYYPDEIVEEVRNANDIVDVISSYISLSKKGGSYFGLCPFHSEKTPSFSVSRAKQMYYCFGCGAGGNVFSFVMQYENFTFEEALRMLAERAGIKLPEIRESSEQRQDRDLKTRLLEIHKLTAGYFYHELISERGANGLAYLQKRSLSPDTIRHFGLGYSSKTPDALYRMLRQQGYDDSILRESGLVTIEEKGAHDKFWNRVMFPIMDVNNRVIGFGGRVLGDGEPKYLNSPETRLFDKSRNLYGLNYARKSRKDYFILCEGYMDVISLHQAGFTNAVATLGTSLTQYHPSIIKRYVNKVILTYDSDAAGLKAAQRAIPILNEAGINTRVLDLKPYKDPDEFIKALGTEAFEERIQNSLNAFVWEMGALKNNYDLNDPRQKTDYEHMIAERLCEFSEPMERDNFIHAVSRQYMIPYEDLRKLVNRLGNKGYGKKTDGLTPVRPRAQKLDEGLLRTQRFLISRMAEDRNLLEKIRKYLSPEDFEGELYRETAAKLYEKDAALIINDYIGDPELQSKIASILNAPEENAESKDILSALALSVSRIKQASLDRAGKNAPDIETLQRILKEQAEWKNKRIELE